MSTAPAQSSRAGSATTIAHGGHEQAGTTGQPNPQLVAETKNEIRQLVQEIAGLAQGDLAPLEFYTAFLNRVVSAMAAVGGAVWTIGEGGRLKAEYQINLAQTGVENSAESRQQHGVLLKQTLAGQQAIVVPPGAGSGADGRIGNPSDLLLVLTPLVVEKEPLAVVEIFQRPGGGPTTQRGYLRFLVQMCDLACEYLRNQRLRRLQGDQQLWRQIDQFVQAIHRSLELRATSFAVVNEGRRLIQCDRVSLALRYGNHCRIEAISGLDTIERRSAEVKRLSALAEAVLRTGEPFWQGASEAPPQIEQPLEAYVDQSHARMVAVLPLVPAASERDLASGSQQVAVRPLGAIIIEQMRDARLTDTLQTRAELVAQHSAGALVNAIGHSSLFLLPLWRALGKATWMLRGRTLPKTLLAVGLFAGAIAALACIQTDFEVAARGKLQPAERHEVFAQLDGVVVDVPVGHGEFVQPGALLAQLTNTNLELELAALIGRQTTNQEQLAAHQRAMLDNTNRSGARLSPADESRLASEMLELRQESENLQRELVLLREKQQQLTVVAPNGGQVITWKVEDLLLGRPVVRGQALLTLANPAGPWELELYVPERRLKHMHAAVDLPASTGDRPALDVVFTLSSHPGEEFHGRVVEMEEVAEIRGDEGNTVLARVEIDRAALPPLHDQTTVTAKLYCGRTSIGYAWFCDLIETVQTKVLFWLPS